MSLSAAGVNGMLAAVPTRYSIAFVIEIVSGNGLNLTLAAGGAAGRLGRVISAAADAAAVAVALRRTRRLAFAPVAAGIKLVMFRGTFAAVTAVHVVPLVLYSMAAVTPDRVSAAKATARPAGAPGASARTATSLTAEAGAVAVAVLLMRTVLDPSPMALLVIVVPVQFVQVAPLFVLNCSAAVTPVIVSVELL